MIWGEAVGGSGIGKSTLLLQVCRNLANSGKKVLYISGEESLKQISIIEAKYDNRVEQISQAHEEEYLAAVQREDMEAAEQVSKEIQEEIMEAYQQKDKDIDKAELRMYLNLFKQSPHWLIISAVFSILSSVGGLMWLVIGFIDSKRGPNKYGPSIKYPRG